MAKRLSGDELRTQVAWGLLNLNRPDLLDDSPLAAMLSGRPTGFLRRGKAIRELLVAAATEVSKGLAGIPAMADKKSLLDEVVQGKTIAQWAREHGRTREAVSRRVWHEVTEWVADEVQRLSLIAASSPSAR